MNAYNYFADITTEPFSFCGNGDIELSFFHSENKLIIDILKRDYVDKHEPKLAGRITIGNIQPSPEALLDMKKGIAVISTGNKAVEVFVTENGRIYVKISCPDAENFPSFDLSGEKDDNSELFEASDSGVRWYLKKSVKRKLLPESAVAVCCRRLSAVRKDGIKSVIFCLGASCPNEGKDFTGRCISLVLSGNYREDRENNIKYWNKVYSDSFVRLDDKNVEQLYNVSRYFALTLWKNRDADDMILAFPCDFDRLHQQAGHIFEKLKYFTGENCCKADGFTRYDLCKDKKLYAEYDKNDSDEAEKLTVFALMYYLYSGDNAFAREKLLPLVNKYRISEHTGSFTYSLIKLCSSIFDEIKPSDTLIPLKNDLLSKRLLFDNNDSNLKKIGSIFPFCDSEVTENRKSMKAAENTVKKLLRDEENIDSYLLCALPFVGYDYESIFGYIKKNSHKLSYINFSACMNTALLSCSNGIIRVFPAYHGRGEALFRNLRTHNGFIVSAEYKSGLKSLCVESLSGNICRISCSCVKSVIRENDGKKIKFKKEAGTASFKTAPDEKYLILI